ncbi:hypothetical protein BDQ17DRAFT_1333957 [Cyathus striatus]|nr:hypothetical protein BDQ17DRAFT_1333957 [Cyathus striatus]
MPLPMTQSQSQWQSYQQIPGRNLDYFPVQENGSVPSSMPVLTLDHSQTRTPKLPGHFPTPGGEAIQQRKYDLVAEETNQTIWRLVEEQGRHSSLEEFVIATLEQYSAGTKVSIPKIHNTAHVLVTVADEEAARSVLEEIPLNSSVDFVAGVIVGAVRFLHAQHGQMGLTPLKASQRHGNFIQKNENTVGLVLWHSVSFAVDSNNSMDSEDPISPSPEHHPCHPSVASRIKVSPIASPVLGVSSLSWLSTPKTLFADATPIPPVVHLPPAMLSSSTVPPPIASAPPAPPAISALSAVPVPSDMSAVPIVPTPPATPAAPTLVPAPLATPAASAMPVPSVTVPPATPVPSTAPAPLAMPAPPAMPTPATPAPLAMPVPPATPTPATPAPLAMPVPPATPTPAMQAPLAMPAPATPTAPATPAPPTMPTPSAMPAPSVASAIAEPPVMLAPPPPHASSAPPSADFLTDNPEFMMHTAEYVLTSNEALHGFHVTK